MSWSVLLENLVLGLPGERPGGLVLSVLAFLAAAVGGAAVAALYAAVCVAYRFISWPLMVAATLIRGVPPILLVFALVHVPSFSPPLAGVLGLTLYSFSHVGEAIRAYLVVYPRQLSDASRVTGLHPFMDWLLFRLPWAMRRSLPALATHWISLLKDTGALVVLGVAELTTTAKLISESTAHVDSWALTLATAALLYFLATCALLGAISYLRLLLDPTAALASSHARPALPRET
jgi:ABC-type amino acid transport system permease subunit